MIYWNIDLLTLSLVFWGFIAFSMSGFIFIILGDRKIGSIWRKMINYDYMFSHQHEFISILTEIMGILFIVISFFFPWYHIKSVGFSGIIFDRHFYYFEMFNNHLLIWMLYYAYLSVIFTLLVGINYKMINYRVRFELAECLFLFPCMVVLINIEPPHTFFLTSITFVRYSGILEIGYLFFLLGFVLLVINGVQLSIHRRAKNRN